MMNERIKELALQAGAKLGPYVHNVSLLQPDGTYKWDEERHTDTTTMDLAKFAELIVQECFYCVEIMEKIAHASNADIPPDYDRQTYLKTLEAVTGLMKAHFGVEEK